MSILPQKKSILVGGPLLGDPGSDHMMGGQWEAKIIATPPLRRPAFPSPYDRYRITQSVDDVGKHRNRFSCDLRYLDRFINQQTHKSASSWHLASYCPRNKKQLSISSQTRTRLSLRYIIPDLITTLAVRVCCLLSGLQ